MPSPSLSSTSLSNTSVWPTMRRGRSLKVWRRVMGLLLGAACAACATAIPQAAPRAPGHVPVLAETTTPLESEFAVRKGQTPVRIELTARHGIILTEPLEADGARLPAEASLGLMIIRGEPVDHDIPDDPQRALWCALEPDAVPGARRPCFADLDQDGALDFHFTGQPRHPEAPFTLGLAIAEGPLAAPAAYRIAEPQERPTAWAGYEACGPGEDGSPPRFSAVLSTDGETWIAGDNRCGYGAWRDERVDIVDLPFGAALSITQTREGLRGRLVEATPQTAVFLFRPGHPPRPLEAVYAEIQADLDLTSQPALAMTRAPDVVESAEPGEVIVSVPARHAITGVLGNRVSAKGLFAGGDHLPVGQPLYGVPVHSDDVTARSLTNRSIMWCAPRPKDGRDGRTWRAICLPEVEGGYRWWRVRDGLYAQPAPAMRGAYDADAPTVRLEPIDFADRLALEAVFVRWEADAAILRLHVAADADTYVLRETRAPRGPDGVARTLLLGVRLQLTSDNENARITAFPLSRPAPIALDPLPEDAAGAAKTPPLTRFHIPALDP